MVLPGIIGEAWKAGSRKEPAQLECDRELCTLCGGCAPLCPVDALAVFETYLDIDRKRCTACGACAPGCPTGALKLVVARDAPGFSPGSVRLEGVETPDFSPGSPTSMERGS